MPRNGGGTIRLGHRVCATTGGSRRRWATVSGCFTLRRRHALAGGRSLAEVRDSAGISIATNSESNREDIAIWRVDPEPELVIGQAEGEEEYLLYAVRNGTVLENGATVVMIAMLGHFRW